MADRDRPFLRAAFAVARFAHDQLERAGLLTSDVPEQTIATAVRWCDGDATAEEMREAARGLVLVDGRPKTPTGYLEHCVACAAWAVDDRTPQDEARASWGNAWAVDCLVACGEARAAAEARVAVVYEAARQEARERAGRDIGS